MPLDKGDGEHLMLKSTRLQSEIDGDRKASGLGDLPNPKVVELNEELEVAQTTRRIVSTAQLCDRAAGDPGVLHEASDLTL